MSGLVLQSNVCVCVCVCVCVFVEGDDGWRGGGSSVVT